MTAIPVSFAAATVLLGTFAVCYSAMHRSQVYAGTGLGATSATTAWTTPDPNPYQARRAVR